ncbi:hypothetical protein AAFF_G00072930 [Aldrovandia affinis]|uniref:BCL-6 corepressor n=1 Tax=Aldrovandia affinis TaxID=143900 RepID=A0AAD7RYE6_9TELE|nr:hypothetical protein AAFF_G00072930 [Aldrovandia affinis]
MLFATPLYGTIPNWMSNERVHMCGINEDRKVPVSDGELQKKHLELRDRNHIIQSMVDASAAAKMNPLVALSMDRNSLMRDGLRVHGGMVYPGIRTLTADKSREVATAVPLGYDRIPDLHYKPDVTLESRKPTNGYVGLYKGPPPGLPKPLLVPGGGGDSLGLDRRVGTADKQSDLGLNGSSGYLRLPWVSPYSDVGMYPYLDTKYAALSMYKASFMSQPSPYLPQHLAYQSLCAGAGGGSAERLFYMPPYPPAPISSPLAPPLRIPTATVAPAALSPLVHCQEKGMQSLGPRIHHEPPTPVFGQQPHHQRSHALPPTQPTGHKPKSKEGSSEHRGSGGDRKSSKSPSRMPSEKPASQGPAKDPADKPLDLSAKLGDFGAPPNGFPHKLEVLVKLGHSPTARYGLPPSRELLKETLSSSPSTVSTSSKPLDRPEIISTLHSSWVVPARGPSPAHNAEVNQSKAPAPTVIKNRNLERVAPQQRSSSCPRIGESNGSPAANPPPTIVTPMGRPASVSPSPNVNGEWPKPSPGLPEKVHTATHTSSQTTLSKEKPPTKAPQRPETQEITYKPQQPHLENGHTPSHLYLPQNDAFLPPSLAYANRYLSYSVPDGMSLPHLPLPGKGPVYPHPVLLGSNSLYPAHLAPKHRISYGLPPGHGEFLTYHDSQEMVHPLMYPHLTLNPKADERPERRSRPQDKSRRVAEQADSPCKPERRTEMPGAQGAMLQAKPTSAGKDGTTVCIDLIRDDAEAGARVAPFPASMGDPDKALLSGGNESGGEGAEPELMQLLLCGRLEQQGVALPAARRLPCRGEGSPCSPDRSPLPDLLELQTLRCARTSGDRSGEGARHFAELSKDGLDDRESHEDDYGDDDDCSHGSSRTWRSSLAKRIANSTGYVGDRFKCVTTELYADSSKLSREQRALQMEGLSQEDSIISQPAANRERAMMRFSELELQEKEGGTGTGRESAGPQQSEVDWEGTLRVHRLGGAPLGDEAERNGVGLNSNRVPVLQRCGVPHLERDQGRSGEEGKASAVPPTEDGGCGRAVARKRAHCLEESQGPWGEERGAAWERAAVQAKRTRLSADVWPERDFAHPSKRLLEEVKNLKVCIELTGLSLRQPCPLLRPFRELWAGQLSPERPEVAPSRPPALGREGQAERCPRDAVAADGRAWPAPLDGAPPRKRPEADRSRAEEACRNSDANEARRQRRGASSRR